MPASRHLLTTIVLLLTFTHSGSAQDITLTRSPYSRATTTEESVKRDSLSGQKSSEFKLVVTRNGPNYYWTNRESKPLTKSNSGIYLHLINPDGSGYVKISLHDGSYTEHLNLHLQTITYYGKINDFERLGGIFGGDK